MHDLIYFYYNKIDNYEFTDNVLEVINNFEQEYWN